MRSTRVLFLLLFLSPLQLPAQTQFRPSNQIRSPIDANDAPRLQLRREATDCTALTDGEDGEACYEQDADALYICEPTAGVCDTAAEWRQVGGGVTTWEGLANGADSATLYTSDNTAETFTLSMESAFTSGNQILFQQQTGNPSGGSVVGITKTDADPTNLYLFSKVNAASNWMQLECGDTTNQNCDIDFLDSAAAVRYTLRMLSGQSLQLIDDNNNIRLSMTPSATTDGGTSFNLGDGAGQDFIFSDGSPTTRFRILGDSDSICLGSDETTCITDAGSGLYQLSATAGASPTVEGRIAFDSTSHTLEYGENGQNRTVANLTGSQALSNKDISATTNTYRAASTTVVGASELATATEINTGTDATRTMTPGDFADSTVFGQPYKTFQVFNSTDTVVTGDQKFVYPIPEELVGMNIVDVDAWVFGASSSGAVDIDLALCRATATGDACSGTVSDVLTVNLTIDANESKSSTAATGPTINTSADDMQAGDYLRVDVDGAGTSVEGLWVKVRFAIP